LVVAVFDETKEVSRGIRKKPTAAPIRRLLVSRDRMVCPVLEADREVAECLADDDQDPEGAQDDHSRRDGGGVGRPPHGGLDVAHEA
jgi:hypothetical protein